ncbi:hypothetical protein FRC18_008560 [Serendipita sp. 400]|nr:hypothetical protein FRC18_008560 [Serendipita sp. 400]
MFLTIWRSPILTESCMFAVLLPRSSNLLRFGASLHSETMFFNNMEQPQLSQLFLQLRGTVGITSIMFLRYSWIPDINSHPAGLPSFKASSRLRVIRRGGTWNMNSM